MPKILAIGLAVLFAVGGGVIGSIGTFAWVEMHATKVSQPVVVSSTAAVDAVSTLLPPVPPKNSLIGEALRRQQAAAGVTGELGWLKKRTGIDCGLMINEAECVAMLTVVKDDTEVIARVGEFTAAGVSVMADKQPSAMLEKVPGSISDNGKTLYIYREASLEDIRAFLKR